ncbi:PPK2 family polyphosphate kinase [Bowdeniella nasicola]|nr:PPK2 family polyphosphate kinase [Bowdeniella nasicola]
MTTFSTPPWELHRATPETVLADIDPDATPGWKDDKTDAEAFMEKRGELLSELQERLFADGRSGGKKAILLVIQGMDTSGKGGIVRHVMGMVDPQGVALRSFGVPTAEERKHHYLWRVRRALPPAGKIGVFDRSHYEDVLVVRVDKLVPKTHWEKRYDELVNFEKKAAADGIRIIKVMLHISKQEQGVRLMERLDRADKHWKFNPGDVDVRAKWDDYQAAYQDAITKTTTDEAPWYVVPANNKWYSRLVITELLIKELLEMDLKWPRPRWHADVQKRRLSKTMAPETVEIAEKNEKKAVAKTEEEAVELAEMVEDFVDDYDGEAKESKPKKSKKDAKDAKAKKDKKKPKAKKDSKDKKSKDDKKKSKKSKK